jgi:hypothetical protein
VLLPIQRPVDNPPVVNSILSFQGKKTGKETHWLSTNQKRKKKKTPQKQITGSMAILTNVLCFRKHSHLDQPVNTANLNNQQSEHCQPEQPAIQAVDLCTLSMSSCTS